MERCVEAMHFYLFSFSLARQQRTLTSQVSCSREALFIGCAVEHPNKIHLDQISSPWRFGETTMKKCRVWEKLWHFLDSTLN
jgi:hypothetical protein